MFRQRLCKNTVRLITTFAECCCPPAHRKVSAEIPIERQHYTLQVTGSSGPETSISKIDRRLYFDAFRPFTTQGAEHRGLVRKTWRNGLHWLALRWLLR